MMHDSCMQSALHIVQMVPTLGKGPIIPTNIV